MAEQLALQQLRGDRRAVDRDERAAARRRPWRCSARATTSLPVPVSPVISTVASLSASRPIAFCTSRIAALRADQLLARPAVLATAGAATAATAGHAGSSALQQAARSARPIGLVR